jgi:hypothetical protein
MTLCRTLVGGLCLSGFALFGQVRGEGGFVEIQRFHSDQAHQGVGVGPKRVYAVGSRSITAHDKLTGTTLATWKAGLRPQWIHLDSGVVVEGELFCAHSNYPFLPMTGSVEVFDAASLKWLRRHTFAEPPGSCTWVDWYDGSWWACFAHYQGAGGDPKKDNRFTVLVRLDSAWNELGRWKFPAAVLERFGNFSCSGGSWGADGFLYCTGHDAAEVYVMEVPSEKDELILREVRPLNCLGQGIAWDRFRSEERVLYSIKRRTREVIANRLEP